MTLEAATEAGLKGALLTVLQAVDSSIAFRCSRSADEGTGQEEQREYPYCLITTNTRVPEGYQALHNDIPGVIKLATSQKDDPTRVTLETLFEGAMGVLVTDNYTISGANKVSTFIEGGENENDGRENFMTIEVRVNVSTC